MKKIILYIVLALSLNSFSQMRFNAMSNKQNVYLDGNSLFTYTQTTGLGGFRIFRSLIDSINNKTAIYNDVAIGGRQTTQLINELPTKFGFNLKKNDVVCFWEITNEAHYYTFDTNGDSLFANVKRYCNLVRSYQAKVIVCTSIPRYMSGFDDINITSRINACNAKIRNNWRDFADTIADIAALPPFSSATSYTNTVYYESDGTHLKNTASDYIAYFLRPIINFFTN